jgi:hypothetical protein
MAKIRSLHQRPARLSMRSTIGRKIERNEVRVDVDRHGHNIPSESIFVDDPIDEQADALDLGLADVTALHKEFWIARADAPRMCTHDQNVSGLERDRFGEDLDRGRNVEDMSLVLALRTV